MKKKFSKVLGVALALVLAFSLGIVAAPAPAEASGSVSNVWVQLDGYLSAGASENYTIYFTPGVDLVKNVDTITVKFPTGTSASGVVEASVDPDGDIVHSDNTSTLTVSASTLLVVVTTPVNITAGTEALLTIPGVTNPTAKAYTLEVYTSKETTHVTSSAYRIGATTVAWASVDFAIPAILGTDNWTAGKNVVYTVTFTASASGALTANKDTVTCIFPTGTTVPISITKSDVEFSADGVAYGDVFAVSIDGRFVTVTVPADLADNAVGKVRFKLAAGIRNATLANNTDSAFDNSAVNEGDYVGKVYTDRDEAIVSALTPYIIHPKAISKLGFAATSVTLVEVLKASAVDGITVQTKDTYGNLKEVTTAQDIELTSNTTGVATFTPPTPTVAVNQSTDNFTYKDTAVGTWTITAKATGTTWTEATWDITVEAAHEVKLFHAGVLVDTYTTFKLALPNALAGDTITVSPGTYEEAAIVTVNKELTIESTDGAATTIVDAVNLGATTSLFNITAADVTITGFTLKDSTTTGSIKKLIEVSGVNTATIQDCVFDLTAGNADDNGVEFTGASSGHTISGCTFNVAAAATAIYDGNAAVTTTTISGCTFTGSSGLGIDIDAASGMTVSNNTFDSLEKALDIANGTVTIKGNTIKNSTKGTATAGAINITGVTAAAADIASVHIVGNTIEDNLDYAIYVTSAVDADDVEVIFNNIAGNANGVKNADTTATLRAAHNWFGVATGPGGVGPGGGDTITTYVTYDPWLGGAISLGKASFTTAATALDALATAGVKIIGVTTTGTSRIGAALYTANPQTTPTEWTPLTNGFFDVYVDSTAAITGETGIKLYADAVASGDKAYMWDEFMGTWLECTEQAYSAMGYIWIKARPYSATYPDRVPTIEDLKYTPFAVGTPVVEILLVSIAASPTSVSLAAVGDTQQLAITATYDDASTADVTTTSTYTSSDATVATVSTGGLITAVAEGSATITVTYDTKTTTVAVTVTPPVDILAYYRGLGDDPLVVETSDLQQAADDWIADVVPNGFTVAITTAQLLTLADEWIAAG